MSSAAAASATRWLESPGAEPVKQALKAAVAELHLHAGWAAFDAGLNDRTMHHYTCGPELATEIGNLYLRATALNYAGLATVEHGHPNDGLKMLQFAHVIAGGIASHDQRTSIGGVSARAVVRACGQAYSATALVYMGNPDGAGAKLVTVRELWQSTPADLNG